jgi:hypothetical protein
MAAGPIGKSAGGGVDGPMALPARQDVPLNYNIPSAMAVRSPAGQWQLATVISVHKASSRMVLSCHPGAHLPRICDTRDRRR